MACEETDELGRHGNLDNWRSHPKVRRRRSLPILFLVKTIFAVPQSGDVWIKAIILQEIGFFSRSDQGAGGFNLVMTRDNLWNSLS
jgi:hypothetical protein